MQHMHNETYTYIDKTGKRRYTAEFFKEKGRLGGLTRVKNMQARLSASAQGAKSMVAQSGPSQ